MKRVRLPYLSFFLAAAVLISLPSAAFHGNFVAFGEQERP